MVDSVPDWASGTASHVPQTPTEQTPSWAIAPGGVPAWADPYANLRQQYPGHDDAWYKGAKEGGVITDPDNGGIGGTLSRLGHTLHGAYESSVMSSFGGLVARKAAEMGIPLPGVGNVEQTVRAKFPGQTDDWYKQATHQFINQGVVNARNEGAQEVQQNSKGVNPAAFLAGVAGSADPSWFINPGAGITKNLAVKGGAKLAATAVANAGAHAVMGSADDAAYQILDQVDGISKEFDIKRNLEAAAFNAAFGAAHPVVSDFVTNLYKERGLDTTPSANPTGETTPLTTGQLTPEEHTQYQHLLNTGSVEDIKSFFNDRQGPQPSWDQVHQWVKYRDGVPEGYAQEEFQPQFDPEVENLRYATQQHVDNVTKDWTNKPDIKIWHSSDTDMPQSLKDNPDAPGVYDASTGQVHLVVDRMDSPETLNAAIFHEGLGHFGLAQQFGNRLDSILKTLSDRNIGKFGTQVDLWQKQHPGEYGGDRVRAAEEVLAEASEKGQIHPSWMDAIKAQVSRFSRKIGLSKSYSDAEVRQILAMAHNAVINGKGRDVVGNGFRFSKNFDVQRTEDEFGTPVIKAVPTRDLINASDNYRQTIGVHAVPDTEGNWRVNSSFLPPNLRGRGLGREAYKALSDEVGGNLVSDSIVSDKAARLWEAAGATKSPAAYRDMIGQPGWATHDESPVYSGAKFMRRQTDLEPKEVAEEAYERLGQDYVPRKRSWQESQDAADARAIDPNFVRKIKAPEHLDKKLFIYDNAAHELNQRLNQLAVKANSPEGLTHEEYADSIEAAANFSYVLSRIEENSNEAGRFLNALKAVRYSRNNLLGLRKALEETGTNLDGLTDPDNMIRFLKKFQELSQSNNPKGAAVLARTVTKPYWEDYFTAFHFNAMLSGLSTHVKAPLDMLTGIEHNVIDHALGYGLGSARVLTARMLGFKPTSSIGAAEVGVRLSGAIQAVFDHDVHVQTLKALKSGEGSIVSPNGSAQPTSYQSQVKAPRFTGKARLLSLPTDAITAQDTFFRSVALSQNLYGLAYRQAEQELIKSGKPYTGTDVKKLGNQYAMNPSKDLYNQAKADAEKSILLNHNTLTSIIDPARSARVNMTPVQRLGRFIVQNLAPFIRVASNNIITRQIERSPLALVSKDTRQAILNGTPQGDVALARIIYGTVKLGIMWNMAAKAKDMLTGHGPDDSRKRQAMEASGWRPDAVHENGQYNTGGQLAMSVNPFDMHNSQAQMVADARKAYEEGADKHQVGNALMLAFGSVLHDFETESWLDDIGPSIEAANASGPSAKEKVGKFLGDEAKTWVPNVLNQVNRKFIDTNQRDIKPTNPGSISGTIANSVLSAIPGTSQTLPQKRSVYGDTMPTGASVTGVHTSIPGLGGNTVAETTNPAEKELARLEQSVSITLVSPVNRTIKVAGQSVKLTPDQFEEYQHYAGQSIVMTVQQSMQSGQWQKMSDSERIGFVRDIEKDAKAQVRDALIQKDGWINDQQLDTLRKQLNGE